jgi:hypothetical protein
MGINAMNTYSNNVAEVVSQAAIHLHNSHGSIGTALFDRSGTLIFNNSALRYVNENTLAELIALSMTNPLALGTDHVTKEGVNVRVVALDSNHVFVITGNCLESKAVNAFVATLRQVLPRTPLS